MSELSDAALADSGSLLGSMAEYLNTADVSNMTRDDMTGQAG